MKMLEAEQEGSCLRKEWAGGEGMRTRNEKKEGRKYREKLA